MQPVWENLKRSIMCSQEMFHFNCERNRIDTIDYKTVWYFKEKGYKLVAFFQFFFLPFHFNDQSCFQKSKQLIIYSEKNRLKILSSIIRWQTNVSKARFSQQLHQQRTRVSVRSKHKMKRQRDSAAYFFLRWPENCLCPTQKEKDQCSIRLALIYQNTQYIVIFYKCTILSFIAIASFRIFISAQTYFFFSPFFVFP